MEKKAMCFVCRINFDTSKQNGVFFGNDRSRLRKQECTETISNLLLGSTSHPLSLYFQSAAYCNRCTNTILDVNFSWKQLTALENRINHDLKVLRLLFQKNSESIPNKIDIDIPDIDPDNLQDWENLEYDQVIQICTKVMDVNDVDSVLHPDQVYTINPSDFLKTHVEVVNVEDDYLYLNSFDGDADVKEIEVVGNIVGRNDRIQIYAKSDDTDSSFEVVSSDSETSSYCSSSSGGRRRKKYRKKVNMVQIGAQNPNVTPLEGNSNGLVTEPNKMVGIQSAAPQIVSGAGNNVKDPVQIQKIPGGTPVSIQKPPGGTPVPIANINQVVSSEFLKKFPVPIDKNKPPPETSPISVLPQIPKPTLSSFLSDLTVKSYIVHNDKEIPTGDPDKKPDSNVIKSSSNSNIIIPVINFKPKVTTTEDNNLKEIKPTIVDNVENPPQQLTILPGNSSNIIIPANNNIKMSVNTLQNQNVTLKSVPQGSRTFVRYQRGRPGVRPTHSGYQMKNMSGKGNFVVAQKLMRHPNSKARIKRVKKSKGNDSDSSSKSVLTCSSFSSNTSDVSSSSDESSLYPPTSLANLKKRKKESGNVSSSSSIVILSD